MPWISIIFLVLSVVYVVLMYRQLKTIKQLKERTAKLEGYIAVFENKSAEDNPYTKPDLKLIWEQSYKNLNPSIGRFHQFLKSLHWRD